MPLMAIRAACDAKVLSIIRIMTSRTVRHHLLTKRRMGRMTTDTGLLAVRRAELFQLFGCL